MKSGQAATQALAAALKRHAAQVGKTTPAVRGSDWYRAVVATVGTDGTVTTTDGIVALRDEAYQAPAVGDIIRVTVSSAGAAVALGRYAGATAPNGAWTDIPLLAGFTTPSGIFGPAQYRIVTVAGSVRVEMRGSVACSPSVSTQTPFSSALPAAARPAYGRTWAVRRQISSDTKGVTAVEVSTGGVLQVHGLTTVNATTWFALDGSYYDL
ncbi:hypothetical protein OG784_12730 [Streptomyces sp. NBC_01617]|uniref:hypothetical protein n=1 Tax=Streptomyces sp. NBC_01617 TaxID=2975899 RepID=UPI003866BBC0|nr:hypothetical protein OG784_12730 [Streptomyces sp. NBC_01617]